MAKRLIRVQGVFAYHVPSMLSDGRLRNGDAIVLQPEPTNPHDSNAIRVMHERFNLQLGYIPRERTSELRPVLSSNEAYHAFVSSISYYESKHGKQVSLDITFESPDIVDPLYPRAGGIYLIVNLRTGSRYYGQSSDLAARIKDHLRKLRNGSHENPQLQFDWRRYGESAFGIEIVDLIEDTTVREMAEQALIRKHGTVLAGYNRTDLTEEERKRQRRERPLPYSIDPSANVGRSDQLASARNIAAPVSLSNSSTAEPKPAWKRTLIFAVRVASGLLLIAYVINYLS